MRRFYGLACLAAVVCLCAGCPVPGGAPSLVLNAGDHAVRVGGTTLLTARVTSGRVSDWTYDWRCDGGALEDNGAAALLHAPDTTGPVTVSVTATNGDTTLSGSTSVFVFRQLVVLKADDLGNEAALLDPEGGWRRFLDLVERRGIHCGAGLITNSLESPSPEFLDALRAMHDGGLVEIFHHGYDHAIGSDPYSGEFSWKPYLYQLSHMRRGIELAKEKLGLTLQTFAAPQNRLDLYTSWVVDATPEIKVWLFGLDRSHKLVLPRTAGLEMTPGQPSLDYFLQQVPDRYPYLVLQVHPGDYDEANFAEFEKAVDYLSERGATFLQPIEVYRLVREAVPPGN